MSSITVNRRVLQKLIPIAIGYLALGIACGILAQQAGLTPLEALGMSVLVFAGSGQFIGIAMMAQGAALVSIGLTIFIVNLRHLLFSSTLDVRRSPGAQHHLLRRLVAQQCPRLLCRRLSQPAYRAGLLSADRHVPRHLGQLSHRPENDHHRAGIRASSDPAFADRSL